MLEWGSMKKLIIALIIIIIIGVAGYFLFTRSSGEEFVSQTPDTQLKDIEETPVVEEDGPIEVIGKSANNRDITAYHYGNGEKEVLFVGGIHGGYSWNTSLVSYELMDHLENNPEVVPENVRVTVVPVLNPDGLSKVVDATGKFSASDVDTTDTVPGRFNGNNVDLNRNFDCDWQTTGTWQEKQVDGGDSVFSEPESKAIKAYIEKNDPEAVVVWYSSAGGVFASSCHNGVLDETKTLTNIFADASGYPAFEEFDYYEITGDMVNWLAKEKIPAISVLLTNHRDTEWSKNRSGVEAILEYYR